MELQTIQIPTDLGKVDVQAAIIGQFAIHQSIRFIGVWCVTHHETGGLVSQYEWRHVAVSFAMWLDGFCNLSELWYAVEDGDENAKAAWQHIAQRRKHECYVPLEGKLTVIPKRSA